MTNVIIQRVKKAIPVAYIVLQGLVLLILNILSINNWRSYAFAFLASSTYLWTALVNPGYVEYEDIQQPPRPSAKSEPIILMNHSQIQKAINDELGGQLGVDSQIKNGSAEPKIEDNHECQVGQRNSDENVKENEQQVANNNRVEKKIKKYEQLKYSKDCIKESSKKKEAKIIVLDQIQPIRVIPIQLRQVIRWCSTCKNHQKLRVRHCHQCKRCVSTFDHHCPWMNNCIGQKNKFALLTFSIIQIAQLCYLIVLLESILSNSPYSRSVILLWLVIVIITLVMAAMLTFQIYLISRNITTWEHARWYKIEYLAIFNKTKMRSLFDMGVIANIKTFFRSSWSKQPTEWITIISPVAHKYVIDGQSPTDRAIVVK